MTMDFDGYYSLQTWIFDVKQRIQLYAEMRIKQMAYFKVVERGLYLA